jgi:hypothetical protein
MSRRPYTQGAARVWYVLDCCGGITSVCVYMLIFMADCGLITLLDFTQPIDFLHLVIYNVLAVLAAICHSRAMLTDPGCLLPRFA